LPSLTAGQRVDMYITATISSIATAGVVASAQADTVLVSDVKTETAAILEDTGTTLDGLIKDVPTVSEFEARTKPAADYFDPTADTVANVTAVGTTTNLTNLPAMPADWLTAAGVKADAVTKIQSGLALEATLAAIKGAGWTDETLAAIKAAIDAIDVSALATTTHLQEVEDKVDNVPTLGGVASIIGTLVPQCVDLSTTGSNVTAIKAKTDNLPADPADDSDIDAQLAAVKTVVDAIKTETDGHPTAAEVWSYGTRTLTNSTTGAVTPAEGDTLEVTKDATIIINFTGLGDISAYDDDTTDEEDKVWFTAKENLDDPDSSAVIQIHTLYPAGTTPPDTLDYINGVAATATEGTFQFTDLVAGNATLTLAAAAAADLPIYAVSPLYWDIKILDYSAGTVSVLASGEMYIYGTPTKSIA